MDVTPRYPILLYIDPHGERGAKDSPEPMAMWVVCRNPVDRPGLYVARKWIITDGPEPLATEEVIEGNGLDDVRKRLPAGLYRMDRDGSDDPVIVETWM